MSKITKINLLLGIILIIMSVSTIIWHHQNRQLYMSATAINNQHQAKIALHKQLLSQQAVENDGLFIKEKSKKQLNMQQPAVERTRDIDL